MRGRTVAVGVCGLLLAAGALPAEARPRHRPAPNLEAYSISVGPPVAVEPGSAGDRCSYNETNCGVVAVELHLSGFDQLPQPDGLPRNALSGTARVTRVYGCESEGGRRLHRYDRRVSALESLNTRRGAGFPVAEAGETITAQTFAFLGDRQPGNCPAGTQAMTYRISASDVQLDLVVYSSPATERSYALRGRSTWRGAIPTVALTAP